MTTEKSFAIGHTGFWLATTPMCETFVRTQNKALARFALPMATGGDLARRGVVNETAFLTFCRKANTQSSQQSPATTADWQEAYRRLASSRLSTRPAQNESPTDADLAEAELLSSRMSEFFGRRTLITQPVFPGCGWLGTTDGDVLDGHTLYELKAGDRRFRGIDVRQILSYCALNFSSRTYDIQEVGLVNPRLGVYFKAELEPLCHAVAGCSASELFGEIISYLCEPGAQQT